MRLKKKDIIYYARIFPKAGVFDVLDLTIRTVSDTWFVGIDKKEKQAFLFSYQDIDNTIFLDRKVALEKALNAENKTSRIVSEIFYEEY